MSPSIAIVYLLYYHNESYIDDMVSALKRVTYPKDRIELVIVSNMHPVHGSFVPYIEEAVLPMSGKELPHVTVLPQTENLGFAGGNNIGGQWAIDNGFDYAFFHNNDGFFASNALEPLIGAMEADKTVGAAQSLMLLYPDTHLINSAGNAFQYLGFGFTNHYRVPRKDVTLPPVKEIGYASGAALLMRTDLMKEYGMWDHDFFLYHEDLEWSFRLRMAGYKIVLAAESVFYHKYQFARSISKFYWMERNRFGTMLMYFRWSTLLLLLPMQLLLEVGLLLFAIKGGWIKERIKVYAYWLKPSNWQLWLKKRASIQSLRTVTDRHLFSYAVSGIYFQDKMTDNWVVNKIGNPLLKAYYLIVVKGLIWW
jgi:GT2 family glycosyltransferase